LFKLHFKDVSNIVISRIGRKKAMVLAMVLLILFGFGAAFSPYYYLFAVLRMGVGGCATGLYMCLFVIGMQNFLLVFFVIIANNFNSKQYKIV